MKSPWSIVRSKPSTALVVAPGYRLVTRRRAIVGNGRDDEDYGIGGLGESEVDELDRGRGQDVHARHGQDHHEAQAADPSDERQEHTGCEGTLLGGQDDPRHAAPPSGTLRPVLPLRGRGRAASSTKFRRATRKASARPGRSAPVWRPCRRGQERVRVVRRTATGTRPRTRYQGRDMEGKSTGAAPLQAVGCVSGRRHSRRAVRGCPRRPRLLRRSRACSRPPTTRRCSPGRRP